MSGCCSSPTTAACSSGRRFAQSSRAKQVRVEKAQPLGRHGGGGRFEDRFLGGLVLCHGGEEGLFLELARVREYSVSELV